jgi:hypothetical protein
MLTAYGHKRSRANPVDAVLNKPFDAMALRDVMSRLLAQPGNTPACRQPLEKNTDSAQFETQVISA